MKALIGRKVGMTQIFDEGGNVVAVTVIAAGPCVVTQVKTVDTDGYQAAQIGFGEAKRLGKPRAGHLKASKAKSATLREVKTADAVEVGQSFNVTGFEVGDLVQVRGTSKGKGFAGTIKRHNFHRGPKTHGSHNFRAPGSIGAMYPQRVFRGIRMAGRMGGQQVTTKGLVIAKIDLEQGLLAIKGAVPGPRRSLVLVEALSG